jgi:hypothetical protein
MKDRQVATDRDAELDVVIDTLSDLGDDSSADEVFVEEGRVVCLLLGSMNNRPKSPSVQY